MSCKKHAHAGASLPSTCHNQTITLLQKQHAVLVTALPNPTLLEGFGNPGETSSHVTHTLCRPHICLVSLCTLQCPSPRMLEQVVTAWCLTHACTSWTSPTQSLPVYKTVTLMFLAQPGPPPCTVATPARPAPPAVMRPFSASAEAHVVLTPQ